MNSPTSLSVKVKELGNGLLAATKTCAVECRVLQANLSKTKVFSSMSMSDLNTLAVGDYALPMITNLPAIDSFGVVAGTSPWTSSSSSRPQRFKAGAYTLLIEGRGEKKQLQRGVPEALAAAARPRAEACIVNQRCL